MIISTITQSGRVLHELLQIHLRQLVSCELWYNCHHTSRQKSRPLSLRKGFEIATFVTDKLIFFYKYSMMSWMIARKQYVLFSMIWFLLEYRVNCFWFCNRTRKSSAKERDDTEKDVDLTPYRNQTQFQTRPSDGIYWRYHPKRNRFNVLSAWPWWKSIGRIFWLKQLQFLRYIVFFCIHVPPFPPLL